jgi:penicillin-binding protein 2
LRLLLLALFSRLFYLQVIAHEHFRRSPKTTGSQAIAPNRGLIYDRNGILLADNLPSYRLEITAEQVEDMPATLTALAQIIDIRETDRIRFEKLLRSKPRFEAVPLRFHLSDEEVGHFSVNRHRFPGVDIQAGLARHYPLGKLAVHALGYVGRMMRTPEDLDVNYNGIPHRQDRRREIL